MAGPIQTKNLSSRLIAMLKQMTPGSDTLNYELH